MTTVVLKIGGSLFDLSDLGVRLTKLLDRYRTHRFLLFPGGGDAADLVRGWQPCFGLTDAEAHDLAIASLDFNAALLTKILPQGCLVRDRDEAERAWQRGHQPVLAPSNCLAEEERCEPAVALPHTWNVTSDSLAAWVAWRWLADEVWFCKSVPCPPGDAHHAATEGDIDLHFSRICERITVVRWCNLREDVAQVVQWRAAPTQCRARATVDEIRTGSVARAPDGDGGLSPR